MINKAVSIFVTIMMMLLLSGNAFAVNQCDAPAYCSTGQVQIVSPTN